MDIASILILLVTLAAISWATFLLWKKNPDEEDASDSQDEGKDTVSSGKSKKQKAAAGESKKAAKSKQKDAQSVDQQKFSHQWLVSSMKGHSGQILDIDLSPNDKFLASCADDRTVFVWVTKDLAEKDHKGIRVNIPFDNATLIRWSPDNKAFVIAREEEKVLEVYKLGKKSDNSVGNITAALRWAQGSDKSLEYIGLGIACNGKFIMNCTKDGEITLRDVKGSVLKTFFPKLTDPLKVKVSPCGRYVVVAGTELMEFWEVKFDAVSNTVKDVAMKWQFKTKLGAKISDFDINADSSKVACVACDGSWGVFDTTGNRVHCETDGKLEAKIKGPAPIVSISGDSRIVVIGANNGVYALSAFSGTLLHEIPNIYKERLSSVVCSSNSKFLLVAGDNVLYVFKNVSWYEETVRILRGQLLDVPEAAALHGRLSSELEAYEKELGKL